MNGASHFQVLPLHTLSGQRPTHVHGSPPLALQLFSVDLNFTLWVKQFRMECDALGAGSDTTLDFQDQKSF